MIPKIDYKDGKYPLGLRIELANFKGEWEIIPELLPQIEERKGKVFDLVDSQIAEVIKIYRGGFSEQVMYSKDVISAIKEYDGTLRGLFSLSNFKSRYNEVDNYLEGFLLNNGISHNDIGHFLVSKGGRWFYDEMIERIYEFDEGGNEILLESRKDNIELQKKYINEHLSDILNFLDGIK